MTNEEAIRRILDHMEHHKIGIYPHLKLAEALEMAISALRSANTGDPLTLEQLREMDGKPVFLPETNCWALVTKHVFIMLLTFPDGEKCSANEWYKQVGPAYAYPPAHIDREA